MYHSSQTYKVGRSDSELLCLEHIDEHVFVNFEQNEYSFDFPGLSSEFLNKTFDSRFLWSQSSGDNFTYSTQQKDGSTTTLCDNMSLDQKSLPISSKNQPDNNKGSQPYGVACVSSGKSASKIAGKKRIRWTRDLHDQFVMAVYRLGGPQNAKPKAILEMMNTDALNIFQVKSHLQKHRTIMLVQKASEERSVERHQTDDGVITELQLKICKQIEELQQLQLEVRKSVQEQLEIHILCDRPRRVGPQKTRPRPLNESPKAARARNRYHPDGSRNEYRRGGNEEEMDDFKKRKLEEAGNGDASSKEELRFLLDPLAKPQLVDFLAKLGSQYPSIAEEIKSIASADPVHRKLFVRGLAWNTTSETLCAAFQEHGEIEEGAVIYDKATGRSRGYGFITFKHMESTHHALRAPSKLIDGRLAVCNLACEGLSGASNAPDLSLRKLYIGSLSPEVSSEMLLNFFGRHGEIEEGSVAYDKDTNESRGFGFVTYKTAEAAKKAIDDPEKTLGGRNIVVKYADSHKGKTGQPPVVPMTALPMAPGYVQMQPVKPHISNAPVGYSYPQTVASYPAPSYPSPPTAPAPYLTQGQVSYPPVSGKPTPPVGMSNYPYYYPKQ